MRGLLSIATAALLTSGAMGLTIDPNWSISRLWDEQTLFAVRLSTPRPPIHARNLYHVSAGMYDAWAAYDSTARGVFFFEKHVVPDVEAARRTSISYAAYRILKARFVAGNGPNIVQIQADFDATFAALGYDANNVSTEGNSPEAIGNRIASVIVAAGLADGSNNQNNYAPNNGYVPDNVAMPFKIPGCVMINEDTWQPLAFDFLVLQNGEIIGAAVQAFIGPHWGGVTPFAINDFDRAPVTNLYFDQGAPPTIDSQALKDDAVDMIERSASVDPRNPATMDISLAVFHNSPLGSYEYKGYGVNPVTGEPYPPNVVKVADFARTVAEFWADGPTSETPPGHWHVIANLVSDKKATMGEDFLIGGTIPVADRLEWDTKMYLAVGGANHDAAVVSWGMKGYYDSARPISFIRSMAQAGQSSDPDGVNYHPNGLPLIPGLIEQVTEEDVLPGGRFAEFVDLIYEPFSGEPIGVNTHVGEVVTQSWLGGLYGGVTGVATIGPLPGHAYRDNAGWHMGGFALSTNDSAGQLNPGLTRPRNAMLSEIRLDQTGDDADQYIELSGPPRGSMKGLTLIQIGDEVQTKVPSSQGRIQIEIDLSPYSFNSKGTFLISRSTLTIAKPDLATGLYIRKIGNTTFAIVTGYTGHLGQDLDFLDIGTLDTIPWTKVVDSVAMRRATSNVGIYSPTVIGPDISKNQLYGVGWQLAANFMPYQSSTFVTPPFAGYTSGHSTYSRGAAEVLTQFTGSPYLPGGIVSTTIPAGWSNFEVSPSVPITLEWASYYDGADEAGISRIYGGIHPRADDIPGRVSGAKVGDRAVDRAMALFQGLSRSPDLDGDGSVGAADLALLLGAWGSNGGGSAGGPDLDGDGNVGAADLAILLGSWS